MPSQPFVAAMSCVHGCLALVIGAALAFAQADVTEGTVPVRLVDRNGGPLPGAIAWTMPKCAIERPLWIPPELVPWYGNEHELLRRLGTRRVAGADGTLRVPAAVRLAAEHGGLTSGVETVGNGPCTIVLDDRRWTIHVRDDTGRPVAGVPIVCSTELGDRDVDFDGLPIGVTDADGTLLLRPLPAALLARFVPRSVDQPEPRPRFALFEVDGMYLPPHHQQLPLDEGASGTVTLTMPAATRLEVQAPDWNGPIADRIWITRLGKGSAWDSTTTFVADGKHLALVGSGTRFRVELTGSTIGTAVDVPLLPAPQPQRVALELDAGDVVVRARVHVNEGPAAFVVLQVRAPSGRVRTPWIHADRAGRFALVLRPDTNAGIELALRVDASPDPALRGATARLAIPALGAGDRRDLGILHLRRAAEVPR